MKKEKNALTNILLIITLIAVLCLGGLIVYDKILKKEESYPICEKDDNKAKTDCPVCEKCENGVSQCNCPNNSQSFGETISSLEEIKLTEKNQIVKIENQQLKIKLGTYDKQSDVLAVNDYYVKKNANAVHVDRAYLTDKFMFFTGISQDGEMIDYAIDKNGYEIVVNNNQYQVHGFNIVNGYLHTKGHIFCGLGGNCPDKDLLIKYIDNTLIVIESK